MAEDIGFFEIAASAMQAQGLVAPEQVHAERTALHLELGMEPPPAYVPPGATAPTPAQTLTAATLGGEPAAQGQAQPEAQPVDPLDALVFQGASSPSEFRFGALPPGVTATPEGMKQEIEMRSFMHAEQIPASIGSEIGRLWNKAAAAPPTPEALEQGRQSGTAALTRLWGDDTQHHLAVAQAEVQRMAKARPEIIRMLEDSGLGNSPWLVSSLYSLAKARGRG